MKLVKTSLRRRLLFVTFAGFALCIAFILHIILASPIQQGGSAPLIQKNSVALPTREQASPGLPVRLKIPVINVDAAIESVGLTSNGEMGVPKSPANAAWYNRGPRPGEKGSSVIDGHFGYNGNVPAVFDNLSKLQSGDKLYIKDQNGVTNTFVVREKQNYDPKANTTGIFLSNDGKAHLNLITCEGAWNKAQKSYSKRLVVFTDKVL